MDVNEKSSNTEKLGSTEKLQNRVLNALRKSKQTVTMYLMNGYQMKGQITGFDEFCVVIHDSNSRKESVVYKHAISTISPEATINWRD